jgi:deoxyribose-phosphate aldolase
MKSGDDMASRIDYTLLKADATEDEIRDLCREAREYGFAAVCVNPVWVNLCRQQIQDTGVMVVTVVGFPLGAMSAEAKTEEAARATRIGTSAGVAIITGDDNYKQSC